MKTPIVLSGGGARGFAHVGVLQALAEAGVFPSAISATSAGALVGAFIADGYSPEALKDLALANIHLGVLIDFRHLRSGLISLRKLGDFMRKHLRHRRIEDLPMPFYPFATNFSNGNQHLFTSGDLVEAVLAACSIPAIFPPVIIDGIPYVDGGLYNNLPVEPFANRKQEVIAVHVNPIGPFDERISIARTIDRAFHVGSMRMIKNSAEGCRLFIEPQDLHWFGLFDIQNLPEIYEAGYSYTRELLTLKGWAKSADVVF